MGTIENVKEYVGQHITQAMIDAELKGWVFNPLNFEENADTLKTWMEPSELDSIAESDELVFNCAKENGVWIVKDCTRNTNYKK